MIIIALLFLITGQLYGMDAIDQNGNDGRNDDVQEVRSAGKRAVPSGEEVLNTSIDDSSPNEQPVSGSAAPVRAVRGAAAMKPAKRLKSASQADLARRSMDRDTVSSDNSDDNDMPEETENASDTSTKKNRVNRRNNTQHDSVNVVRGAAAIERDRQKRTKRRSEERIQREREHALVSRKTVEEPEPEMAKKRRDTSELVDSAVDFFKNNNLFTAVQAFAKSPAWRKGEIFIYVFSIEDGICWAHGDDYELIWNSINKITAPSASGFVYASYKDVYGEKILQAMVAAAGRDGWISHFWNNSTKLSYVQTVVKDGKSFILGGGFYPSSIDFATESLVKRAVSAIEEDPDALVTISNPNGLFVEGDLAVEVYNLNGDCLAHGISSTYVGQNRLGLRDANGVYVIRELIKRIQGGNAQGFMLARWDNLPIKIYYQKVIMPKTRETVFAMSYYYMEDTGKRDLKAFLSQAVRYLEANGKDKAFSYFSKMRGHFVVAGMHIEVYDLKGNCLANGESPEFVGQNFMKKRDTAGNLIIKNLIEDVEKIGVVTKSSYNKGARKLYYAELVKVPDGTYIVSSCLYLHSKPGEVQYLVKDGVSRLKAVGPSESLYKFTDRTSDFFRGELTLAVYDEKGVCLANGNNKTLIWQNLNSIRDEQGKPILDRVLTEANAGGGWTRYRYRNTERLVYSKAVDAPINELGDLQRLIVASGYYL